MDKRKEVNLNSLLKDAKATANNYRPSHSSTNHVHHNTTNNRSTKPQESNKSTNKSKKPKKSTKAKKRVKPSYSNIRTNTNIVDELKGYQIVDGDKSRSDLLGKMIKMCKPILLNSSAKKKKYQKTMKLIKISRKLKE